MSKKKTKVSIQVKRLDEMENSADQEFINQKLEKADEEEIQVAPAIVISRANYPIIIDYGDEKIRLSPRQRVKVANASKLIKENLPADVTIVLK